jgi:hypothetical protein
MDAVVHSSPNELRAAASRWQMIGADLGAGGGAPPVGLSTSWPSAAATAGIHGQATAATAAFQARIGDTASAPQSGASAFEVQDAKVGVDAFKDALSSVSSMIGMFSGAISSVNSATSVLGQLTSTAVSTSSGLVNNLTGTLSHAGAPTQVASTPGRTETPSASGLLGTAPLSDPAHSPTLPDPIVQPPKGSQPKIVNV